MIPFLGAISYRLSPKLSVFLILKDIAFWCLWVSALLRLRRYYNIPYKWAAAAVLLLLLAPYDLGIAGKAAVEEGFLFALVAALFSLILTMEGINSAFAVGLLLAAIYLTKSSMLLLCVAAAIWLSIKYWSRSPWLALLPIACLAVASLGWGIYTKNMSGVFAIGANGSSWNGWNFYKGNNPYVCSLYPRTNLDTLDGEDYAHRLLPFVPVHNEWELNDAQLALGKKYVRENPEATLKMVLKKLFIVCCDLGESPEATPGRVRRSVIMSNVINHLLLNSVFVMILANVARRKASEAEILAALLAFTYVLPYFGGFLYMRHMVPIYGLMTFVAAVQLTQMHTAVERSEHSLLEPSFVIVDKDSEMVSP